MIGHPGENDADWIDRLLAFACRVECLVRGHGPVVSRFGGVALGGPTCLACGRRVPPERT